MADKKFTQKVGYQDSLEFDPVNGIMKYGNYEAFASDMGIKPQSKKVTLDDYIASVQKSQSSGLGGMGAAASNMLPIPKSGVQREKYRAEFESYMNSYFGGDSGKVLPASQNTGVGIAQSQRTPQEMDLFGVGFQSGGTNGVDYGQAAAQSRTAQNVSRVSAAKKLGADEYEIVTYDIAKDKEAGFNLLNQINNRAAQLSRVTRSNDVLRQNQQDAANRRQGRAATVINS